MNRQLEEARARLAVMSERIRVLEDALHTTQSMESAHPLLADDLLKIKDDVDLSPVGPERLPEDEEASITKAFGTLSVKDGSTLRYYGGTAGEVSPCVLPPVLTLAHLFLRVSFWR